MTAYYNEIDPAAAAWLRELISEGHIAPGEVDERDIQDVSPADLHGFAQCHFFAGIGVWSYSLRRAGWPDDRPVWTASCPCQPFSSAGKGAGFDDERHLWPAVDWLVQQCQPECIFGEQVASKDAEPWLDLVQADLEGLGYAFGACAFPSAGVGAPHIRDRTYWVADASTQRQERHTPARREAQHRAEFGSGVVRLAISNGREFQWLTELRGSERDGHDTGRSESGCGFAPRGDILVLADATSPRHEQTRQHERGPSQLPSRPTKHGGVGGMGSIGNENGARAEGGYGACDMASSASPTNGLWRDADWLFCRDGKWRPVEPGTFPLAHGAPSRVGRLRGYGNAINAEAAKAFIESYLEVRAA